MKLVLTALGLGVLVVAATSGWLTWQCHKPLRVRPDWRPIPDERTPSHTYLDD